MRTAFEYLVERIVSRRCVPLVGAGISTNARKGGAKWSGHKVETMIDKVLEGTLTARMTRLLGAPPHLRGARVCSKCRKAFREYGVDSARHFDDNCWICDLREAREARALTRVCEAFLWEHEGPNADKSYERLVKALDIGEFADLDPTPAHFYFAFLAREGLVTELLTTNYDCNFELAYEATWPRSAVSSIPSAFRIFNLPSFASHAALSARWCPGIDTAYPFKVFKINGCAEQLRSEEKHATAILLTASQLQDWRARHWAADYFRTKVRTACLVTVGFGSDEPQVVHTLQKVLEEFSGVGEQAQAMSFDSVYKAANAPVVTTYDYFPSFQQLQLVNGFAAWWTGEAAKGADLIVGPFQRKSARPNNVHEELPPKLSADVLWADVFQAVFVRLVIQQLQNAALASNAAFTGVVPFANQHLRLLSKELLGFEEKMLLGDGALQHWAAELEAGSDPLKPRRPQLTKTVAHMLGCEGGSPTYKAITDHGSLFVELAFLLYLLEPMPSDAQITTTGTLSIWQRVLHKAERVIEVIVPSHSDTSGPGTSVFVSCAGFSAVGRPLTTSAGAPGGKRLEIVIGGPRSRFNDLDRRALAMTSDGLLPVTVVRLDWATIFSYPHAMKDYQDVRRRLLDAIARPTKYRRRRDPSIRSNPFFELRSTGN
jgi:hypothetical protein